MAQKKSKITQNKRNDRLRRFNNALSVVVLVLSLYLIAGPFIPRLDFWWKSRTHQDPPLVSLVKSNSPNAQIPKDNILVIPSLHLQKNIYDGLPYPSLNKGVWRSSNTSTPDKGGNTVFAGHRYMYYGTDAGATFYNLDKLKAGDKITVFWQSKRYDYVVIKSFVVSPKQVSILAPTTQPQITLYTCTPLWTSLSRLVVQARLVSRS